MSARVRIDGKDRARPVGFERTVDAILFDLDGTLCDTLPLHFEAYNRTLVDLAVSPLEWSEFVRLSIDEGLKVVDMIRQRHPSIGRSQFYNLKDRHYENVLGQKLLLRTGVARLLHELRLHRVPLAVVTSGRRRSLELALERSWPGPLPDVLVTYDDCQTAKPDPTAYLMAVSRLECGSDRCIVFEDSLVGIRAAKAAGASCVALWTALVSEDALAREADFVFDSFEKVALRVE